MIKVILFDLGDVITTYKQGSYYRYLSRISKTPLSRILKLLGNDGKRTETGKMAMKEFNKRVTAKLGLNRRESDWLRFYAKHTRVKGGVLDYANKLHKEYIIACLSNIDPASYNYTKKRFNISVFDYSFLSFRMGVRKPAKRAYYIPLRRLGVNAEEVIFIDDIKRNTDAARKIGMYAVLFKDQRTLRNQIARIIREAGAA
jgi:putative hydrolase of the HAD superfamily